MHQFLIPYSKLIVFVYCPRVSGCLLRVLPAFLKKETFLSQTLTEENIGAQYAQSQWRFFSQYGEICPDNLWNFTPPVSPTLTPSPPPPTTTIKKIHYKTW